MDKPSEYTEELRRVRSLLIVTSLQKREDLAATRAIGDFDGKLFWKPLGNLLISPNVWKYVLESRGYDPKFVFCHPDILLHDSRTCLYYRGLCGLSLKAARDYCGDVRGLELGSRLAKLSQEKALLIARTYNALMCSIIENSTDWTLENGARTIIATMGITLDGIMRNKIGSIAEDRIRTLVLEWVVSRGLLVKPALTREQIYEQRGAREYTLSKETKMRFQAEPDISFRQEEKLVAVVEIKGGIDPAGALERYGAARKSFDQAIKENVRCRNFYLAASLTGEVQERISTDRLVEKTYNIIEILERPGTRDQFLEELFRYTLRLY